jgi:hypothetical protein
MVVAVGRELWHFGRGKRCRTVIGLEFKTFGRLARFPEPDF